MWPVGCAFDMLVLDVYDKIITINRMKLPRTTYPGVGNGQS